MALNSTEVKLKVAQFITAVLTPERSPLVLPQQKLIEIVLRICSLQAASLANTTILNPTPFMSLIYATEKS